MSAPLEITVTADTSDAQSNLNSLSNTVDGLGTSASNASVATQTQTIGMSAGFTRMGISALAAFDMISAAGDRLASTQMQQTIAQERLTTAMQKYGAGSTEAIEAQQQLQIATDNVGRAQEQYNMRLVMAGATIIPSLMTTIPKLISMIQGYTTSTEAATTATLGLSAAQLGLITAGVGAIALIGILAGTGAFGGGGGGSTNVNVYGDVNMPAGTTLGTIGTSSASLYRG